VFFLSLKKFLLLSIVVQTKLVLLFSHVDNHYMLSLNDLIRQMILLNVFAIYFTIYTLPVGLL